MATTARKSGEQAKLLIVGSKPWKDATGEWLYRGTTATGEAVWSPKELKCGNLVMATVRMEGDKYEKKNPDTGKMDKMVVKSDGFNLDYVINDVSELDNYAAMKARMADLDF